MTVIYSHLGNNNDYLYKFNNLFFFRTTEYNVFVADLSDDVTSQHLLVSRRKLYLYMYLGNGVSTRININAGRVHQWYMYMMFGKQCSISVVKRMQIKVR